MARVWSRSYNAVLSTDWPTSIPTAVTINQAPADVSDSATILRILLDVRLTLACSYDPAPTGVAGNYVQALWPIVGAGVQGGLLDDPLDPYAPDDPRITLTGTLEPLQYVVLNPGENIQTTIWSSRFELQSRGMRKSPVAGTLPVGSAAITMIDPIDVLNDPAFEFTGVVQSYLRVLYED